MNATGCLEVATTRYPTTAWTSLAPRRLRERGGFPASGVESCLPRASRSAAGCRRTRPLTFSSFAGDGGTYDIGLQALSGALERGHRYVFVCYDNEAYMNTGVQRSGATPAPPRRPRAPPAAAVFGKAQERKEHHGDRRRAPHPLRRPGCCRVVLARPEP